MLKRRDGMKSKRLLQSVKGIGGIWILIALMLFSFGCSKMLPTAPGTGQDQIQADRTGDEWKTHSEGEPSDEWTELCSVEDEGWCDFRGVVWTQVVDFNLLQFRVPPQVLEDSIYITVKTSLLSRISNGKKQKRLEFEFSPDGLVFSKPANIKFHSKLLGGDKGDFLVLYWQNPLTGLWEVQQTVKVKNTVTQVNFEIYHFSHYAISCSSAPPKTI
jgi:hypothetical protein